MIYVFLFGYVFIGLYYFLFSYLFINHSLLFAIFFLSPYSFIFLIFFILFYFSLILYTLIVIIDEKRRLYDQSGREGVRAGWNPNQTPPPPPHDFFDSFESDPYISFDCSRFFFQ